MQGRSLKNSGIGHLKLLAHTCMQLKTEWTKKDKRAQCIWK